MRHQTAQPVLKVSKPTTTFARRAFVLVTALAFFALPAAAVAHQPEPSTIELPGASGAEGIAAGEGKTFFAGDLPTGDVFRGDVRDGTAERFIDAPEGRMAIGLKADVRNDLLFVAGGPTGQAYVYDAETGADVRTYQLTTEPSFINDVALTREGAWLTNSVLGELYFIPLEDGVPGDAQTLTLTGPAADTPAAFNLNGIAAAADGHTLIVAHSGNKALYTVDPATGASAAIAGVSVPNVDGLVVEGKRLWAVQNRINQVSVIRLDGDLGSGTVESVITSPLFQVPTTAALFGNTLAVVNAQFGLTDAGPFEVVLVPAER